MLQIWRKMLASQRLGAQRMGTSYRVRIGLREIAAMEPNTILWDQEVRGFVARRQHSDIVTFSEAKKAWDARAKHLKQVR